MSGDRDTDPDGRDAYGFILSELNTIKSMCARTEQACTTRIASVEHWQLINGVATVLALILAACGLVR